MKMWNAETFSTRAFALEPIEAKKTQGVDGDQHGYAWLEALPIAVIIVRKVQDKIMPVAANRRYTHSIASDDNMPFDLGQVSARILALPDGDDSCQFHIISGSETVAGRELEIIVARYGDRQDHFLISIIDRTEDVQNRLNLRREMLNDSLTGFCNRSGFEEEIDARSLLHSGETQYAIFLIDLARFSRVNESVGTMAGDELIITVARRLKARTRSSEILCRLGGNEFAIYVPLSDDCALDAISCRLFAAFDEPCRLSGFEIQVECAIAAANGTIGVDDCMDVLRNAQIALKRAKISKQFELYRAGAVESAKRRFSIETDLRRALEHNELELHYQPLIDLSTGILSGFEALARWHHPDQGYISPADFIPVAEESGLIVPLGRWALEETARTIKHWDGLHNSVLPIRVSVNVSAVQLVRDDIALAVSQAIRTAGISGNRLTLELTESAFISDPDGAKQILESLKAMDAHLAMDDFGTGYSNLAYLQQLPIDVLKIDRSFITDILQDNDKREIVRAILSLAQALGMKTTAEGIETLAVSSELTQLGCSYGQGYHYAKPMSADAAYEFMMGPKILLP